MPDYTKTPHEYEKTNTKFPDDFFIFNNFYNLKKFTNILK